MQLVRPDDKAAFAKWGVAAMLSVSLQVSGDNVVARTDSDRGVLQVSEVENMGSSR